uniref:Relaxin-3-like n=1 Tax=Astyanax mexicanus TaxID=7994 RepID=A0A3B1JSR8_ASTMX
MKTLLLALLLVCALCPDTARSHNAVRLCGREFLRAVVYTCGGSRWRRVLSESSAEDSDVDGGQDLGFTTDTISKRLRRSQDNLIQKCCDTGCLKHELALVC